LVDCREFSIADRVRPGLINLDEVGAFFHLLADGVDQFSGVVGIGGVREDVLRGIEMIGIFVTAQNVDRVATDAQPRAGNRSAIDGVSHRGVG
jgi:hypothetical protein